MPEMTRYEPGTPSWIDLGSPDVEASKAFYGGLFGWEAHTSPDPAPAATPCSSCGGSRSPGSVRCSGRPTTRPGPPTSTTADADATAQAVDEAGGTVVMPPFDVLDAGRMAVCMDSAGARFSIWQPGVHIGAELVNEPDTLNWNELATRDIDAAKAFYGAVFGWGGQTQAFEGTTYTMWTVGDRPVGGMIQMNDQWPARHPPHWMVYIAVADVDATAAKVAELGGTVPVPPTDAAFGRFAVCNDRHGAAFSIVAGTTPVS